MAITLVHLEKWRQRGRTGIMKKGGMREDVKFKGFKYEKDQTCRSARRLRSTSFISFHLSADTTWNHFGVFLYAMLSFYVTSFQLRRKSLRRRTSTDIIRVSKRHCVFPSNHLIITKHKRQIDQEFAARSDLNCWHDICLEVWDTKLLHTTFLDTYCPPGRTQNLMCVGWKLLAHVWQYPEPEIRPASGMLWCLGQFNTFHVSHLNESSSSRCWWNALISPHCQTFERESHSCDVSS